jgi:hypothetical protein
MENWITQLQPIIDEYKQGENKPLSIIEVDRLTEIIRAKINLKEGNISNDAYENILNRLP